MRKTYNGKKILWILAIIIAVAGIFSIVRAIISTPGENAIDSELEVFATLSSPLEDVEFPSQAIEYLEGWPDKIIFPDHFALVDAISYNLGDESSTTFSTKHRFDGSIAEAQKQLSSFLEGKGWEIFSLDSYGPQGLFVLLEDEAGDSAFIIIDEDALSEGKAVIMSTFSIAD